MPVIRVEVPEGTPTETKENIRVAVKAAVLKTLAPKEVKYDYVAVRELCGKIGDGLPLVEVDLRPGREPERKKALVDAIAGRRRGSVTVRKVWSLDAPRLLAASSRDGSIRSQ